MKTKTTDLSRFSRCLIRQAPVVNTPEEKVRQALLFKMIHQLGFPKGLVSVERSIGKRRTDIVCYAKNMAPLLLVECKAISLNEAAIQQALGYNETVGAPFICLANTDEEMTVWFEMNMRKSVPFLPIYQELCRAARM